MYFAGNPVISEYFFAGFRDGGASILLYVEPTGLCNWAFSDAMICFNVFHVLVFFPDDIPPLPECVKLGFLKI